MLFAPLLLAIATLVTIRRIILELLPMIRCPSLALAARPAANNLIRAITGTRERFLTVQATGEEHTFHCTTPREFPGRAFWRRLISVVVTSHAGLG
jgi:hypothetical protein